MDLDTRKVDADALLDQQRHYHVSLLGQGCPVGTPCIGLCGAPFVHRGGRMRWPHPIPADFCPLCVLADDRL